ncbi:MAG: glycosyltransferase family 39 protein [Actinobacteria bacterium]|nr:glycosyltransferase family 39 protein [Actinomycetota bacterium]
MVVFVVFAAAYLPLTRFGIDPHHDGLMLKPALVVADGGVIHRDVFSQYGPMATWVHAIWVVILGPTLWAIRTGTALMLVTAATLLFVAWRRVFGQGVALVAISCAFLLTPHFSPEIPANPWSADVAFLWISLIALVLTARWRPPYSPVWGSFTVGALVGAALLTRLNLGVSLVVLFGLRKLLRRRFRDLAWLGVGFTTVVGLAALSLGLSGALDEWWLQSVEMPRSWLSNVAGTSGGFFIRHNVFTLAVPSAAIVLMVVTAVGGGLERSIYRRNLPVLRTAFAVVILTVVVVYHVGWSLPGWNRWDASWAVIVLAIAAAPLVLGWWKGGMAVLGGIGGSDERSRMVEGVWLVGLAALIQIYPVAGPRYLWWAAVPALGPVIHMLRRFTLPGRRRALVGVMAVAVLVPMAAQQVWRTVHEERVSIPNVPVLEHMLMDKDLATALVSNIEVAQAYIDREVQPAVLNLCADGLYSTLSANHLSADPYFVFWPFPEGAIDDEVRGRFIEDHRPLLWWCPPAPDPHILVNGYNMRLLPVDPKIRDDPQYEAWPLAGRIGVPREWDPLPGESELLPEGYDAERFELVEQALGRGFLDVIEEGSMVVLDHRDELSDDNGFILRYLERDRDLRFVDSLPALAEQCGDALCDGDGAPISVMEIVLVDGQGVLLLSPIASRSPEGLMEVSLPEARLFGPAGVTPLCDFPATIDQARESIVGAEGWASRRCTSGPITLFADLESWVADGCVGRSGWWLCSPPIDEELAVLADGALDAGLFDGVGASSTVVLGDVEAWRDGAGSYLEDRVETAGVRFVGELPAEVVVCGEAAWCDAEGRRLYVLDVVDGAEGPVLVLAPVGDIGSEHGQTVIVLGHVRLAGPADRTPSCDLASGMSTGPSSGSSVVVVRSCTGAPVMLAVFVSWVADGCQDRPGWWLCP